MLVGAPFPGAIVNCVGETLQPRSLYSVFVTSTEPSAEYAIKPESLFDGSYFQVTVEAVARAPVTKLEAVPTQLGGSHTRAALPAAASTRSRAGLARVKLQQHSHASFCESSYPGFPTQLLTAPEYSSARSLQM